MTVSVVPVRLWMAWTTDLRPHHLAALDEHERARLERFRRPADATRSSLGAALVRAVAAQHLGIAASEVVVERGCPQCGLPHGKPHVPGGPHLSLAHTADLVVVAITAAGPIGVDVEHAGRPGPLPATPDGSELGRAGALRTWTRREAVVKAIGDGRAVLDGDPVVTPSSEPAALLHAAGCDPAAWAMDDADLPHGYLGCVAVMAPGAIRVESQWAASLLDLSGWAGGASIDRPSRPVTWGKDTLR